MGGAAQEQVGQILDGDQRSLVADAGEGERNALSHERHQRPEVRADIGPVDQWRAHHHDLQPRASA